MTAITFDQVEKAEFRQGNFFKIMKYVFSQLGHDEASRNNAREIVFRLLEGNDTPEQYQQMLDTAVRELGFFPYLDPESLGIADSVAFELHKPLTAPDTPGLSMPDVVFHRAQAQAYWHLLDGQSLILSAPTSFGKSLLIDAIVTTGKFSNIVVVVPTIALIDETRRRLSKYSGNYKLITHASQAKADKNIFVLTQERVIEFPELGNVDFFVIDEFYKLHPTQDAERAATLNHAFYKLVKKANQFYMLGPNISAIPEGFPERFKCKFFKTDAATVASRKHRIHSKKNKQLEELATLCEKLTDPTLIFCSSPPRTKKVVEELIAKKLGIPSPEMIAAADWVGANFHKDWIVTRALRAGIGIHHGRLPRSIAQLAVRAFNEGKLKFLVCTSTLIEGVNTKARNVVVFDDSINNKKYDYFTFCNIRGRSGRMFQHYVGDVYLFHQEPQEELPYVDIPVFTQSEDLTPDDLLIQIEDADLRPKSKGRVDAFRNQTVLDFEVLRKNTGVDPTAQIAFAHALAGNRQLTVNLGWSKYPTYAELKTLCETIFEYFIETKGRVGGVSSGSQLTFKLFNLRNKSISEIIDDALSKSDTSQPDTVIEDTFELLRHWVSHKFGKYSAAIQRIQNFFAEKQGTARADYGFYAGQLEHFFSDSALIALDEYGLPFPLAKKMEEKLKAGNDLDKTLDKLRRLTIENLTLSSFEKRLLTDVRNGL